MVTDLSPRFLSSIERLHCRRMVKDETECEWLEDPSVPPSVCSGHKIHATRNRFEPTILGKLLRNKRKLVAGVGLEPTALEL